MFIRWAVIKQYLLVNGAPLLCATIYVAVATEVPGCSFLVGLLGLRRLVSFCIKICRLRHRSFSHVFIQQ